ncbi:hypothetical protein PHYBLDRAFT_164439 [Phycomyces blakesleeanus NRRL 1555(-)]|uniref:Uncharacterized protein n=1 Tax=Phycomyces blakesleeanus (strain ATCC 8743b / DSM 1359 / FGSC 10004 / NBRC 33097 / NRRL 1555) TaxID=763407 RepID=A0A162UQY6_PHYB8|nr:hypothetical protein PHYBLDRAFT_164439 [Phycomyces blakesleeanus NRRL 1555(-)]OAD77532.1 hypothetical protein PHYBLDRAFT_164439 [Phycomyces blakesleeanus NRRL 1555(-)]|eukprot:XP_018295572.1 hypothetical protein PHYBLDRAFT_164439 [Phycomyces blakesleeanus NRRL 1555(-)]
MVLARKWDSNRHVCFVKQCSEGPSLGYLDNVMSRFGHHLSPNERSSFSTSMTPHLQSATPGAFNPQHIVVGGTTIPVTTATNTTVSPTTTLSLGYDVQSNT